MAEPEAIGYVHLYTGDGKGKTTAAIGLAVRAAGAGKKVYIGQFVKDMEYGEIKMLRSRFPEVTAELYGKGCFLERAPQKEDFAAASYGLSQSSKIMWEGGYDVVILDEITIALYFHLIELKDILQLIDEKPVPVELVLTGRYAPKELTERCDLVTEMKEIKHYYQKGVLAREGIER